MLTTGFRSVTDSCDDLASVFEESAEKLALVSPRFKQSTAFQMNFKSMRGKEKHWPEPLKCLACPAKSQQFGAFDVHLDDVWRGNFLLKH